MQRTSGLVPSKRTFGDDLTMQMGSSQQQYSAAVTQPSSHYTLHPIGSAPGSSGAGMPDKRGETGSAATGPVNKSFEFINNAVSVH